MDQQKLTFTQVNNMDDHDAVLEFLCAYEWPFHSSSRVTLDLAKKFAEHEPNSSIIYWILSGSVRIGLLKILDLDDIGDGCPVFDLRVLRNFRRI